MTAELFVGLVPMFAPDAVARLAKVIEPLAEATPLLPASVVPCTCSPPRPQG